MKKHVELPKARNRCGDCVLLRGPYEGPPTNLALAWVNRTLAVVHHTGCPLLTPVVQSQDPIEDQYRLFGIRERLEASPPHTPGVLWVPRVSQCDQIGITLHAISFGFRGVILGQDQPSYASARGWHFLVPHLISRWFQIGTPSPPESQGAITVAATMAPQSTSVTRWANRLGISNRTLRQRCARWGLGAPKTLLSRFRILRIVLDLQIRPELALVPFAFSGVGIDPRQLRREVVKHFRLPTSSVRRLVGFEPLLALATIDQKTANRCRSCPCLHPVSSDIVETIA